MSEMTEILALEDVTRSYPQAESQLDVLRGCSFALYAGQAVALIGPSGAGKSTLLHIAGLLEKPDAGVVRIAGQDVAHASEATRTMLRRQKVGFVYQFHHLLPEFSARENIILPQMINGISRRDAGARADALLAQIGLTQRASHRPARLSGGEQQRVAIARALANKPALLIADEPTGNLDPKTAAHVFDLLQKLVETEKIAFLMATHNHDLAARMQRRLAMADGQIQEA